MKAELSGLACLVAGATIWCGAPAELGAADDSTGKVNFTDHVLPVLEAACLNCHNPDQGKGGLDLTSYAAVMAGGSGGQVVQAGSPDRSRLFTLAAHLEEPRMPPNKPKMEQAKLDVLKRWIEDGLLEAKGSKAKKATGPTLASAVETTGERPKDPAMPRNLLLQPEVVTSRASAVTALAASPWAPLVAVGGPKQVVLYRTEPLELVGILPFADGFPETLAFSRNGDLLLAGGGRGGKSGLAVAWDVRTGQRAIEVGREFDAALAADISPNHRLVALGGPGRNIKVYDAQTGEQLRSIKKHPDWLLELKFSPDGVLFASGGRNGEIFVWEAETGIEFYELADHQKPITGLSWRADSNVLAACSEDGNATLWEMQNGKQLKKWTAHPGGALAIHFSPDGSRLVTGGRDRAIKIWDLNGRLQREIRGLSDIVTAVAFTHEGKQVVAGDWRGDLRMWDAGTGSELGRLLANPPGIDAQLARAQQRAGELEAQLPRLEMAASAAGTAAAGAAARRDAAAKALAQVIKEQADAAAMLQHGEKLLAEASARAAAAGKAAQAAERQLAETRNGTDKLRSQVQLRTAALTALDRRLADLPQGVSALDRQVLDARRLVQDALQARDAAKHSAEVVRLERDRQPGNAEAERRLSAAQAALETSESALRQAETRLQEVSGKRAAAARDLAAVPEARSAAARDLKASELLLSQQPVLLQRAEQQAAQASATLAEARKLEAGSRARVEEAKKMLASGAGTRPQREAALQAAGGEASRAEAAAASARAALERSRKELDYARYEVDKWRAAKVNVELRAQGETLREERERLAEYQGKAKSTVEAHEAAAQSLAEAEQALRKARVVVRKNTAMVDSATDQVVESGLKVLAAGIADGLSGENALPATQGRTPAQPSRAEALAAQKPEFKKELEFTSSRVKQTLAELAKASQTARETPPIIDERSGQRAAREADMKQALDELRMQEQKVEALSARVDQLRRAYEALHRETWDQKPVASSAITR